MRCLGVLGALLVPVLFIIPSAGQDPSEAVDEIFDRIERTHEKYFLRGIEELKKLGRGALEDVRRGLRRADPYVRMAAANYLYAQEFRAEAVGVLLKVAADSADPDARVTAASMLGTMVKGDPDITQQRRKEIADPIARLARETGNPAVRVHLWLSVWNLTRSLEAKRNMQSIFEEAASKEVKDDAALALAEMDGYYVTGMKAHLKRLSREPSLKGRLARAYLDLNHLMEEAERAMQDAPSGKGKYDFSLLEEVLDKLAEHYHDPEKIQKQQKKFIEEAARGIAGSLDDYTSYYDRQTIKRLKEDLSGSYGGIGARVSMRKDRGGVSWLTIEEPIFSGPAYKAGLRSNDIILDVEGESTANKDLMELVKRLRGKPGTKVTIKVSSVRWKEPRNITITRGRVQLETVQHVLLPGNIGYIKLTTFGTEEDEKIERAVEDLESRGTKALVLDLRGNSGGYLDTAIRIADLFLDRGLEVVRIDSDNPRHTRAVYRTQRKAVTNLPMVVLINGGSASASEILAGALRDHKRAVLVGEKSYGKGSVQRLFYLDSTNRESAVRITIAKWYLPGGESIEKEDRKKSGIEPQVKVELPDPDLFKAREWERLRASPALQLYLQKYYPDHRELFQQLAEWDGNDYHRYPHFEELYKSLDTRATREEVRELLRDYVRRHVQDDRQKEFPCDYQTDLQLRRAIREVGRMASIPVEKILEYRSFGKKSGPQEKDY